MSQWSYANIVAKMAHFKSPHTYITKVSPEKSVMQLALFRNKIYIYPIFYFLV